MTEILGWIGNLFIVVGLWKIGDKCRHAFLFSIIGETAWVAKSLLLPDPDYALACICAIFCGMAFRNWLKWGQDV